MQFSLYIHYPFCISRCHYCGFATTIEDTGISARYRIALLKELNSRLTQPSWQNSTIQSVYFGGGTPALMPPDYTARILNLIEKRLTNPVEITLEANPETCARESLDAFRRTGVNRLSIGAQSFIPDELNLLGRTHTVETTCRAIKTARKSGFENLSLDLIYGIPGSTTETFATSIRTAVDIGIEHLSTYTLSIEEHTPFARRVANGTLARPDGDLMAEQFDLLCELMADFGFEHYELTNFARPGFRSVHNSAYWSRIPYLGVGCGAHSFDGARRFWNSRDVYAHMDALDQWTAGGSDPAGETEILSDKQILEETVYLSLRTTAGIDLQFAQAHLNPDYLKELESSGYIYSKNDRWLVAESHWLMLDDIVLKLLS